MSRNRNRDSCCNNYIKIEDLIGKPLEFRKYGEYAPHPGVKWSCPTCKRVFFVWIQNNCQFWNDPQDFDKEFIELPDGRRFENVHKGKFARWIKNHRGEEVAENLGYYHIDTSYYESFNEEGEGIDTDDPAYLCTTDDDRTRLYIDKLRKK